MTSSYLRQLPRALHRGGPPLLLLAAQLSAAAAAEGKPHCFQTGGVSVCHNPQVESVFYRTPENEVAYNVQVIHDGGKYYTIYHAGPKGKYRTGDSIKTGVARGAYTFSMPQSTSQFGGSDNDPRSLMDSDGVGGGGNPMTASGLPGDSYFYMFFLGVSDDGQSRNHAAHDWRHYLLEARTKDFVSFDVKAEKEWMPFKDGVRPAALKDSRGDVIRSHTARSIDGTQGQIGSISFVNGVYHYFYYDYAPDGGSVNLYHRTSADVGTGVWSPEEIVLKMPGITMVRVAKAKDLDRWVVMYGCYVGHIQDVCLQYTETLNVVGHGGLSDLSLTPDYAMGFSDDGKPRSFTQPYWLTDRWGNLDTVGAGNGGEMYWTDMNPLNCQRRPYAGCPVYGGAVYRAGWTAKAPAGK